MAHDADAAERQRIAEVLADWANRDPVARDRLVPLVYEELRRLAHHYMRNEREGHTLQTTALVNEVYLRLAGIDGLEWRDRAPLFRDGGDADAPRPGRLRAPAGARQAGRRAFVMTSIDENVDRTAAVRLTSSRSTKRWNGWRPSIRNRAASSSSGSLSACRSRKPPQPSTFRRQP